MKEEENKKDTRYLMQAKDIRALKRYAKKLGVSQTKFVEIAVAKFLQKKG